MKLLLVVASWLVAVEALAYPGTLEINWNLQQQGCIQPATASSVAALCTAQATVIAAHYSTGCSMQGVTGIYRSFNLGNGGATAYCVTDMWRDGTLRYPNQQWGVLQRSSRYVCPGGGTSSGSTCVCDASWQTDTGTACNRTGGPCPTYPGNTTSGCNGAAHRLLTTMPAATDVRSVFHETLACGIRTACTARCQMDNCKWLEHVSPASTGPYLNNEVPWPQLIAQCNALPARPPGRIAFCAGRLASQNIRNDLTEALVQYGCGTDKDWDLIYEVNFSFTSQCMPARSLPRTRLAMSYSMKALRTQTRNTCIARRTAAGLDPFINNDLRGQTC